MLRTFEMHLFSYLCPLQTGDVFLSAASIAYYGAFTRAFRIDLVAEWISETTARSIPVSADSTLKATLASPVEVRVRLSQCTLLIHSCL
jgi:hypothetical protein